MPATNGPASAPVTTVTVARTLGTSTAPPPPRPDIAGKSNKHSGDSPGQRLAVIPARVDLARHFAADPRHFQILALGSLLVYGVGWLGFELSLAQILVTLSIALTTQWLLTLLGATGFEARSALISALSLCLLLRVESVLIAALAAALAIASKFALRWRGSHLFNPTAFAISVLLLSTDAAWIATGQWGHAALAILVVTGLGLMVLTRARRIDIALTFALAWSALILARICWYHDPLSIAVHQLSNGAVLLFCLFMLTDPRTTPSTRRARVLFAVAVATLGATVNFSLYRTDGLILALTLCAPLTPLLNAHPHFPRWPRASVLRPCPLADRRTS